MELRVPKEPHLTQPLRPKTLFTISMDESNDDMAVIKCCINPLKEHDCTLHYGVKVSLIHILLPNKIHSY